MEDEKQNLNIMSSLDQWFCSILGLGTIKFLMSLYRQELITQLVYLWLFKSSAGYFSSVAFIVVGRKWRTSLGKPSS